MVKSMTRYFFAIASLGAILAAVMVYQIAIASPAIVVGVKVVLFALLGLALVAIAAGLTTLIFWCWGWVQKFRIDVATKAGQSVIVHTAGDSAYAVNPLGLPIQPLHLDSRNYITPGEDVPDHIRLMRWLAYISRQRRVVNELIDQPLLAAPALLPILPAIINDQRLLVSGGMGSGKTNLLRWIAYEKARTSKVLVIDTHAAPGLWPIDQQAVLGRGRNWPAVETALQSLLGIMDRRYKDIDAGTVGYRGHEIITVIADEWTMIPQMIGADIIKEYSKPVLIESRKVGIDFILATHDTTVESLGTRGMSGLIRAFDWIIETQRRDGQYICKLRKPGQKPSEAVEYAAPPLFVVDAAPTGSGWIDEIRNAPPALPAKRRRVAEPVSEEPQQPAARPTDEENDILVTYFQNKEDNGDKVVWSQVCAALGITPGTHQYNRLKNIVRKWTKEDL